MRFHRALGDVEIASDFRVVTSLEKQLDDLPFPGAHLLELLFHKELHLTDVPRPLQVALQSVPPAHLDSGRCVSICIPAAKLPWNR